MKKSSNPALKVLASTCCIAKRIIAVIIPLAPRFTFYGEQCPIVCISYLAQWSRHGA